jgi:hypothetical protein
MPQPLEYDRPASSHALEVDERPDGGVTITVPTRRATFGGVLWMLAEAHLLAVVAAPVVWAVFKVFASRNPRAVLRLTPDEFILTETSDDGLGYATTVRSWPRASIADLRPNRYVNGLYLRVPGRENVDLLGDLPAATVQQIGAALAAAQGRLASALESVPETARPTYNRVSRPTPEAQ